MQVDAMHIVVHILWRWTYLLGNGQTMDLTSYTYRLSSTFNIAINFQGHKVRCLTQPLPC